MYAGGVCGLPLPQHEPDGRLVVGDRLGVRHRTHSREPANGRRSRAGSDGFDVLAARLAQMAMDVDESGRNDEPRAVDDLVVIAVRRTGRGLEGLDRPVGQHEIANAVEILRWIQDSSTA